LNTIKENVKHNIETMASSWSEEQRQECVAATADCFHYAGAINKYLMGYRE
jgi:hypothetical protein